jgi:hypothetical protein
MRKGYLLNEVLMMLPVILVVMLLCAKSFRVTTVDVPRMYRDFQENVSVLHMLRRLQRDIETAGSLPDKAGNMQSGDEIILIESGDGVICYRLSDGKVTKGKLALGENIGMRNVEAWNFPHASISWKIWEKNGTGYAVEVTTSIRHMVLGHWQEKLKNSHVYFVGTEGIWSKGL